MPAAAAISKVSVRPPARLPEIKHTPKTCMASLKKCCAEIPKQHTGLSDSQKYPATYYQGWVQFKEHTGNKQLLEWMCQDLPAMRRAIPRQSRRESSRSPRAAPARLSTFLSDASQEGAVSELAVGWEERLRIWWDPCGSLGRWVMCQTLLSASCLESQSGSAPFPRAAMHRAEVRGLSGEHRHCCSAGAGIQGGLWASAGTCEAEHSRLTPDFLSTVQLGGEGSCSISHTCLAFLDVTAINK